MTLAPASDAAATPGGVPGPARPASFATWARAHATLRNSAVVMSRIRATRAESALICEAVRHERLAARLDRTRADARRRADPGVLRWLHRSPEERVTQLVESNLCLAEHIAARFRGSAAAREDLVQVAYMALVQAAHRFDGSRGVPFEGYASLVISGRLKHYLRDHCWDMRVPRRVQELWLQAGPARERLSQQLGRAPTVDELAVELGACRDDVLEALDAQNAWAADSFSHLAEVRGRPWEPALSEAGFDLVDNISWLKPAIAELDDRLRRILHLRFVEDMTQSQIASQLGISQMHVSRLLSRALQQLRAAAA